MILSIVMATIESPLLEDTNSVPILLRQADQKNVKWPENKSGLNE